MERTDIGTPTVRFPLAMPLVFASLTAGVACTAEDGADRPPGRYSAVGGLDAAGEWLYIVGGGSADGILQDAWRLQVATGTWERLSDPPAPMLRGTATRDAAGDLLVFGGEGSGYADLDALWRWQLEADAWTSLGSDGPPVRKKHAAAWDGSHLWIHGGEHNDGDPDVIHDDLWAWSDAGWGAIEAGEGPGGAYRQGLAYDASNELLWMHAGYDGTDTRTDRLWSRVLTHSEWTEHHWEGGPPVRASHSFVWTAQGGCGLDGPVLAAWGGHASDQALWCFDPASSTWTGLEPTGDAPLPRDAQVADLAPDGRTLVLACGDPASEDVPDFVCDAWTLDLQTGSWTELVPIE